MKMYFDGKTKEPEFDCVIRYDEEFNCTIRKQIAIEVKDDGNFARLLKFCIVAGYDRCCGVREIGALCVNAENYGELYAYLQKYFTGSNLFENIGALNYTLVKDNAGFYNDNAVAAFIKGWPGASSGNWFFNPNSGNYVQMWTLPVNQHYVEEEE